MKKHILSSFIVFLLLIPSLLGKEITKEVATTVAFNFLAERNMDVTLSDPLLKKHKGVSSYFAFNFETGFIIISANTSTYPVLAYSFESNYGENNYPPSFVFWMQQVANQIETNEETPNYILHSWEHFLSEEFRPKQLFENISPLLSTKWDQGKFYNSAFPADTNFSSGHPYAGCVAVAIGQIMKYYNWPKTGNGQNTIPSPYGELIADFGNTNYDWMLMENDLSDENSAVAELLYHGAIAVNSEFYPQGTGAYDNNIPPALINYFNFKETAVFLLRNTYFSYWEQLIREELDKRRPVIYGAADLQAQVGHTFICDGYQDSSFFHFNWGWGGAYNGYYYLDSLLVENYHFDYQHDIVMGIEPNIVDDIILYPAENLNSQIEMRDVILNWGHSSMTSSLELLGYNIFRNDTLLTQMLTSGISFIDSDVSPGPHEYKVQSAFIGEGNGPSISVEVYISNISNQKTHSFVVYPNPAKDFICIKTSSNNSAFEKIELFELSGKNIYNSIITQTNGGTSIINLPNNLKGIYILKLKNATNAISKKIFIDSNQ